MRNGPVMSARRVEGADPSANSWVDSRGVSQGNVLSPFCFSVIAAQLI
jgi:hypothetical protein